MVHAKPRRAPQSFSVAIVGGGIGGLTCALSLAHHCPGIVIDVYEQAPQYKEIGAGVGLNVSAARVLHKLGLLPAANAISGERNGVHRQLRRWDNGEEIVTMGAEFDQAEIHQLSVHRAEYLKVLYDAISERKIATLHTGKRALRVEDHGDSVSIGFEDGTEATAHLLVGCDGIHSTIRGQFVQDNPRYSGRIAYRGLVPIKDIEPFWPFDSFAVSWLGPNKHFLTFPISSNKTLNIVGFASKSLDELGNLKESWTSQCPRSELEEEYAGWDANLQKVIKLMTPVVGKWRLNDREPLSDWTHVGGKVVLLGDSAHAMLPHQGSGAGHATEDCYILGKVIQEYLSDDKDTPLSYFTQLYQSVRLPRAQKAQITSRQAGDVYEMQGVDFEGLSFDECLPIVASKLKHRMKWVYGANLDAQYDEVTSGKKGKDAHSGEFERVETVAPTSA